MKEYNIKFGEKEISVRFDNFAEQANGEVTVRCGETVVLAVVTMTDEDVERDFFPLSVSYEEKFYAAGKISGSRYTRREGKPSDKATLTSRMIDRAIRPKFPEGLKREVQVIVTCLSFDEENDPGVLGMIAASLALHISDIPWNGPLGSVRLAKKEKDFLVFPTYIERDDSDMDSVISGFFDNEGDILINMIDGSFNETSEETTEKAFDLGGDIIKKLCEFQEKIKEEEGKEKADISISPKEDDEKIKKEREKEIENELKDFKIGKEYKEEIKKIKKRAREIIEERYEEEERGKAFSCFEDLLKKFIRKNILEKEERIDGRKIDELRKINCSVGILPRTHGSALFERGETKALSIITLGAPGEQQLLDDMELSEKKRFMHHYNFPPYSVGEVRPIRGPGRREIGHGMIGEKGILPLLPTEEDFSYTIRAVSEIVSSNGSTSMASVCGVTLALMDAGVPIRRPVAGISIGLVMDSKENYKVLTDIQGIEDHCGDMDFKVAGTREGITVIQLDVKIEGLTKKIIKETLQRAKETRILLIEKIEEAIPQPRENLSPYAPRIVTLKIDPEKIGDVIGPKGKTINEIIEKTEVTIDIDDLGIISVSSQNEEAIERAISWIKNIVREVKEGEVFVGKVVKLFSFGAVVEILPGQEGLVHISEIANRRIEKVEDVLAIGQEVKVKVIKVESGGKTSLSIKRAEEGEKR